MKKQSESVFEGLYSVLCDVRRSELGNFVASANSVNFAGWLFCSSLFNYYRCVIINSIAAIAVRVCWSSFAVFASLFVVCEHRRPLALVVVTVERSAS